MQLCELQRVEDFEVIFENDIAGPLSKEQTAIIEKAASNEQVAEEEDAASEGEAGGDAPTASDTGRQADRRGDTTESSDVDVDVDGGGGGDGDGDDDRAAASSVPSTGSDSDSAAYKDSELERDIPPPVSSSRGKSPVPGVVEQVGGGARV